MVEQGKSGPGEQDPKSSSNIDPIIAEGIATHQEIHPHDSKLSRRLSAQERRFIELGLLGLPLI